MTKPITFSTESAQRIKRSVQHTERDRRDLRKRPSPIPSVSGPVVRVGRVLDGDTLFFGSGTATQIKIDSNQNSLTQTDTFDVFNPFNASIVGPALIVCCKAEGTWVVVSAECNL